MSPTTSAERGSERSEVRSDDGWTAKRSSPDEQMTREGVAGERRPFPLLYPEYGPVDSVVGFGLFYLLVDAVTPTLVEALAGPFPDLASGTVTTGTALALWAVFGLTVLTVVLTQAKPNPRRFDTRAERDAFLDANRPTEWDYRLNLALLVLGGSTAALAWGTAVDVLRGMLPVVVDLGGAVPSVGNVAVFVVFFVGFAAYSRGLDRLVVGGLRELLYRYHLDARDEDGADR